MKKTHQQEQRPCTLSLLSLFFGGCGERTIKMVEVKPYYGLSRVLYLQELCNRFGNFKVARGWLGADGEVKWTKHHTVLECWQSEEGLEFLKTVNNRGGLGCEVRIDLDPPKEMAPEEARSWFDKVCDYLEGKGIDSYQGFFSGSRGYHISAMFSELITNPERKEQISRFLIRKTGGEGLKVSDSSLLTLEWAPNNKTGRLKVPVRGNFSGEWLEV